MPYVCFAYITYSNIVIFDLLTLPVPTFMFVLLTLTIPRSLYLSEYKVLTAVQAQTKLLGSLLFGGMTLYVMWRC